jgi:hypothetical protein
MILSSNPQNDTEDRQDNRTVKRALRRHSDKSQEMASADFQLTTNAAATEARRRHAKLAKKLFDLNSTTLQIRRKLF